MKNSLLKFVKSKKLTQESYEYEHPYDPNVLQFNRGMQNPTMTSSGKRKKSKWISVLHQEVL